ncbi:hypothetical protein D3C73_1618430 [compost metagenome]
MWLFSVLNHQYINMIVAQRLHEMVKFLQCLFLYIALVAGYLEGIVHRRFSIKTKAGRAYHQ